MNTNSLGLARACQIVGCAVVTLTRSIAPRSLFPNETDDFRQYDRKGWRITIATAALASLVFVPISREKTPDRGVPVMEGATSRSFAGSNLSSPLGIRLSSSTGSSSESAQRGQLATAPRLQPSKDVPVAPLSQGLSLPRGSGRPPRFRKLTVFGNGDGELWHKFADGGIYRPDVVAFASNEYPLGTLLKVTTPAGRSVTGPVRDRMARRFSHSRIDSTIRAWALLTDDRFGTIDGCEIRIVSLPTARKKRQ